MHHRVAQRPLATSFDLLQLNGEYLRAKRRAMLGQPHGPPEKLLHPIAEAAAVSLNAIPQIS